MPFGSSAAQRANFERLMKSYAPLNWWKFTETSGTNLADYGSDPHAATLNTVGTTGSLGVAAGPAVTTRPTTNNALRFTGGGASGTLGAAQVASSTSLYQIFGTSCTLTIGCFIKVNTVGTAGFVHFPNKQGTVGFRLTITNSTRVMGASLADGTSTVFPSASTLPNDGAWHLVCCVIDRSIAGSNGTGISRGYLDGVASTLVNLPAGFGTLNQTTNNYYPVQGTNSPDAIYDISDAFIINQVLSLTQIRALYKAGVR